MMKSKSWLTLLTSLGVILLASSIGVTTASFVDLESSGGNTFEAWASVLWQQTTQSDFEAGVLNNVDTASSAGDVQLENIAQEPTTSVGSEETWYFTSWSRRAPVTINNTGSALTDYQVNVDVTYDADMQPDFDDIRFVDSDDSTELSHWRESYIASTSAVFWVKVPSVPSGDKTIYMYYGNPVAGSATNGAGTFIVFIDKNSTAGWSESNLTVETSGDFLRFYNPTAANVSYALRYDLTSPSVWSLEARFKNESLGASDQVLFALLDGNASNRFTHTISPHWLAQNKCGYYDGAEHEIGTDLWAEGTEYIFIHRVDEGNSSTGVDFYVCDTSRTLLGSAEDVGFAVGAPTDMDGIGIGDGAASATCDAYFRWIFLRNYASPEPTTSIGTEDGWSRRAPVTINNPDSALTDYQVMVDITYDADMQPGFDDIRFRDSDGSTELAHWGESYIASTSAVFWVKVPSVPSGNKTIYMYYGNDAASDASDGDATFEFFDDFEDGDISDWSQYGSGTVQIADDGGNSVLLKTANNDPSGGYSLFNNGSLSDFEAVLRTKRINETGGTQNRYGIEDSSFNGYGPRMYDFNSLPSIFAIERRTGGLSTDLVIKSTSAYEWDTWMTVKFRKSGSILEFELYDSTGSLVESIATSNSLYNSFDRFVVHGGWEFYTDDIRVRKYIQPAYSSPGTIASQVLDTGAIGATWDALFWDETLQASTDITFEVRASDTAFLKDAATPSWTSVGGTSPVTSGLPLGRYMQWRATLTTSDPSETPVLHEVRVYYY